MIYKLQDEDINLSKLEYISKVYDNSESMRILKVDINPSFNYQINGKTYTIDDKDVNKVTELRENLLEKWQEFKKSNIYLLNNTLIDLNKLERVGGVQYNSDKEGYGFRYSVNGFTWNADYYREAQAKKMRDNLLKAWYLYKGIK